MQGSSGNISMRTPDGMLISPTGTDPDRIEPDDLVAMGLYDPAPRASSEWALHAALYNDSPTTAAIVHTHADACTALACLNEPLPPFHYLIVTFGGDDVRCAPYATFGTPALAALAVDAMRGRLACLLANHGMLAAGPTLGAAVATALRLETLARQYLMTRAAGRPCLLTPQQMAEAHERYLSY